MANWSIPRALSQAMRLAVCLLPAASTVAAEPPQCAQPALRIAISGELQPAGPKPVLLVTVPEPEAPAAPR